MQPANIIMNRDKPTIVPLTHSWAIKFSHEMSHDTAFLLLLIKEDDAGHFSSLVFLVILQADDYLSVPNCPQSQSSDLLYTRIVKNGTCVNL